jgi:uncharacterized protein (TIGR03437 family)
MTIAYKFCENAENEGLGYRGPLKRMLKLLQLFDQDMQKRYDQRNNTQAAATFRSTLMVAALSFAFSKDLRAEFRNLNFPIDDQTYNALYQRAAATIPSPAVVSAASFAGSSIASESIVAVFGANFAATTLAATSSPLPTRLAGASAIVKDSAGTQRVVSLFFVSPDQINCLIPSNLANGGATIAVTRGDGFISFGTIQIAAVAPGLFSANSNGQGVASALALRVKDDGSQIYEPIAQFDAAQNKFVSRPIDLGPQSDQVFLVLFGTGMRFRSALTAASASIGGVGAPVLYVGQQGEFIGLDQVNIPIPRSLIGRGEVDVALTIDTQQANTVKVNIK